MLKERWCMIMTKTWRSLLAHPERRRGYDRRQCADRRLDARIGESTYLLTSLPRAAHVIGKLLARQRDSPLNQT